MFRYENNGKLSKPGETPNKVVTKARPVTYINRFRKDRKIVEKVSQGWEIVEERIVSPGFQTSMVTMQVPKTVVVNHRTTVRRKEDDETGSQ